MNVEQVHFPRRDGGGGVLVLLFSSGNKPEFPSRSVNKTLGKLTFYKPGNKAFISLYLQHLFTINI